jgi:hypothetical protein
VKVEGRRVNGGGRGREVNLTSKTQTKTKESEGGQKRKIQTQGGGEKFLRLGVERRAKRSIT